MDIFISNSPGVKSLEYLAKILEQGLPLTDMKEGESSNYFGGQYFEALLNEAKVKLYYLDTEMLEDWIYILDCQYMSAESVEFLAEKTASLGLECFIAEGNWYKRMGVPRKALQALTNASNRRFSVALCSTTNRACCGRYVLLDIKDLRREIYIR
ncbi:hypothetical protein [Celerinatantimonas yamalensis]|uniref:Uncharacterized protein n=1 Tax=Celerinatantimonas yamalensis TaxID=559956 RepID=A0ABW9G2T4_9GAMM